jgi:hypothetical protein
MRVLPCRLRFLLPLGRPAKQYWEYHHMNRAKFLTALAAVAAIGLAAAGSNVQAFQGAKKTLAKKGTIVLYNGQKFQGEYAEFNKARTSMALEFPIGSIAVFEGESWEICEGPRFKGACRTVTSNEEGLGGIMVASLRPTPQPAPAQ